MDEDGTVVLVLKLLDKYANRPNHHDFDQMCYADFSAHYISAKAPVKLEGNDIRSYTEPAGIKDDYGPQNDDLTKSRSRNITLKNGLGKMKKHDQPMIIRFNKFSRLEVREKHYRQCLVLHLPWKD